MTISLAQMSQSSSEAFVAALGGIFEHSPWVAEAAWAQRPFKDVADLHAKMAGAMRASSHARQLALLRAHPELAGRAMVSNTLTADSTNEQTRSGLTQCTPEELRTLQTLNAAYNRKFGWPFILAVKHLDRAAIIRIFGERLENSAADEFDACLANIETITRWRLDDQVAAERLAMKFGPTLMQQADALARFSEDAPRITRTYLSAEHQTAGNYLIGLMHEAGMQAGFDALGNIVGRYAAANENAPVVMTGSHQDSVRNAGKYDGLYGILTAIACVKDLHARGKRLPYHLEVVGFGDEEGVRFGVTLIGSKAMAGSFDPTWLDKCDAAGISMRAAMRAFGGDPDAWASLDRRGQGVAAFVESHIEQGPVLLNEGLSVGVVTAIAGATRLRATVTGLAGHAGTVPMGQRQDALTTASEMVLFVERYCTEHKDEGGLVGTVGVIEAKPGAINVIPQDVMFTIDVRSGDDAARRRAVASLRAQFSAIATKRNVALDLATIYEADAAPCDVRLQAALGDAIASAGVPVRMLPSGAGHDAMVFPAVCPIAMLFVRCGNNGISHHPDETMTAEDAEVSTQVLLDFFERFVPGAR